MALDISLINSLNSLNLMNQLLSVATKTSSLNGLLSNATGKSSLLSGSAATSQLSVNLSTLGLVTASGSLTNGNPLSVFSGNQSAETITNAVKTFVSAFNKAVTSLSGSSSSISKQGAKGLVALAEANSEGLEAVGISIDKDGKLVVDSDKLEEVAESKPKLIQTVFNDTNFITTVSSKAKGAISQVLGLTGGAGFMAVYNSSLNSGTSSLLSGIISSYM